MESRTSITDDGRRARTRVLAGLLACALLGGAFRQAAAVESWADPALKVSEGLVAWYDISRENAARKAAKEPRLRDGGKVAIWHDASGGRRHLVQPSADAQPVVRTDDELRFVRFDGQSQWLTADGLGLRFTDATVFLVAAPFSNDGNFRALIAWNAAGANDYQSGLNVDQGPFGTRRFDTLNVEGPGFGGAGNLKQDAGPFGQLTRICLTSTVGPGGTSLFLDGEAAGRRDRGPGALRLDRLTVGARYYTNGGPPETRGLLCGEIAEVLVYDRLLADSERLEVDRYLKAKYGERRTLPLPPELAAVRPIPRDPDPPPVQMLAPGFEVRALPVDLPNINNVRYRHDGKLVALGYDGHMHLLTDSNGDGLEDRAESFWDRPGLVNPIGMALTPPGYARGQGAFVACRGQLALVVDTDGDDRADDLVVAAGGWEPIKQSVDTLGVAIAPDGSIYYGRGTEDYTNGHLVDDQGAAHYSTDQDRGAIHRLSADFKTRERVCSGVRFSVALAFNRHGDLFSSDQEGATWLPNGNPFDELLHIEPGRHYGFPPAHPRHLPGVIDEPSVYDYRPQHQSTCGLCFNDGGEGNNQFGPAWWRDDAFMCGYSRGKLYRTTLVKTAPGYVAESAVLGCLNMLTVDACVSPKGQLIVATHSGGPDWGSGPGGKGKLYQITYTDRAAPQPVRAWVAGPHEVRIAFDRQLNPDQLHELSQKILIEHGPHVRAGDRFESLWPGYSVVEMQARGARRLLPVLAAGLTSDQRSLVLTTGKHAASTSYAVLLPDARGGASAPAPGVLSQRPVVELSYDLGGVEAEWRSDDGKAAWNTWLPHLDVAAASGLLTGSFEAERLAEDATKPGELRLRTQLDLWQMLRPAVQPGSKLDAELPAEHVTVVLESDAPFSVFVDATPMESNAQDSGSHRASWTVEPHAGRWQPIEVVVRTGAKRVLAASWHTAQDQRPRAFLARRFFVPWARPATESTPQVQPAPAELAGGDWHRGRELFYSEQAQCSKCHTVHGRGGWIGPDLSNLVHRDYTSVLRDITQPSFAINPDHLAYQVVLDDGRVLTGRVQTKGDTLVVGDIKGVETEVPRASVEEMKAALISIMPEELPKAIGAAGMRDLLTFLLAAEPGVLEPAPIEQPGAPEPRTRAEVGAVLGTAAAPSGEKLKPLSIVLVAGPKDHGPGEHDYPAWQKRWTQLLSRADQVKVETAEAWPSAEQWKTADVVAMFSANPAWEPAKAKELDAFFARGGGLVLLHYAVNGQRAPDQWAQRIGLAWNPNGSRFRHGELDLNFQMPRPHPITAGFTTLRFVDESYWNLIGDPAKVQVLATQVEEGKPQPLVWTYEPPGGRVFCSILGHYSWTFDDPLFRVLVLRGMAWVAREPVDRFASLALPGARVSDSAAVFSSPGPASPGPASPAVPGGPSSSP
jgi:putative heme-binding domain-containing protein